MWTDRAWMTGRPNKGLHATAFARCPSSGAHMRTSHERSPSCLLVGVIEKRDPATRLKVAQGYRTVAEPEALLQWMEQAVRHFLVPATLRHRITPLQTTASTLLSVEVEPSRTLVALWDHDSHTVEYTYRTSHGKEWMNPDDIERRMLGASRAGRLAFESARARARAPEVSVSPGAWIRYEKGNEARLPPGIRVAAGASLSDETFQLTFHLQHAAIAVNIPFSQLRDAWVDPAGRLSILLGGRLVTQNGTQGQEFILEPLS